MSKKQNFKLQFSIHGETKPLNLTPEDKVSAINKIVISTYKVDIADYDVLYNKNKVNNFDKAIKEIIGKDEVPIFTYNKIPKMKPEISKLTLTI
jgi:hypothetical protein